MRIDSAGNVGIGTVSPSTLGLQVTKGAGVQSGVAITNPASSWAIRCGASTNYLDFTDQAAGERMRIDSSGNVGIGTSSPSAKLHVNDGTDITMDANAAGQFKITGDGYSTSIAMNATATYFYNNSATRAMVFGVNETERMRIDTNGHLLVGQSSTTQPGLTNTTNGISLQSTGRVFFSVSGTFSVFNRNTDDGGIISLRQAGTEEGTISVSGTTVSYNGGHLSRWAQTTAPKDESIVKGTVLSNLDEMNVYTDADGNPVDNEQLNKVKVSDVEGDANVAGVFVNWNYDEDHSVDEINMAMTGDMIIRIAQGVTVQRGDLLMSAGDGTAKPQGDDIVRSKTVAKVTSTHVSCTYADGSYCVPCVLMAC
jgi:hypothetical protein